MTTKQIITNEEMLNDIIMEDFFDDIMEVTGRAMIKSANEIAPMYGAKDYNEAYDMMDWNTYRYDYLDNVMNNAFIDLDLIDEKIKFFLEHNDIQFDINFKKYYFEYVKGNLCNWE